VTAQASAVGRIISGRRGGLDEVEQAGGEVLVHLRSWVPSSAARRRHETRVLGVIRDLGARGYSVLVLSHRERPGILDDRPLLVDVLIVSKP
jgi:hypothetical protein